MGSSKTHALVVDETGRLLGFGKGGAGNHEGVGYEGFMKAVRTAVNESLDNAGLNREQLSGAGFGISGYDWPSERKIFLDLLKQLELECPYDIVNDSCLGLLAGSSQGWGVAVVAGTGCNCWGWTEGRKKVGQVTGSGGWVGEGAGASELVTRAVQMVAYQWTMRGPATRLSDAFISLTSAGSLEDFLEGLLTGRYDLDSTAAPLVFSIAESGDEVAREVIHWAGTELGELAKCVIRQLNLEDQSFEVVLIGSLFDGGELLTRPLYENVLGLAAGAHFIRLAAPPAIGAALLGMEVTGIKPTEEVRKRLEETSLVALRKTARCDKEEPSPF